MPKLNDDVFVDFTSKVEEKLGEESCLLLRGYLTKTKVKGQVRLYMDPALEAYVDIAEDDIHHAEKDKQSKLGASFLWVCKSAKIKAPANRTDSAEAQAPSVNPFTGEITQGHLNKAARPGGLNSQVLIGTQRCNATTSAMRRFMTADCNATTGAMRNGRQFMTVNCNATTPNALGGSRFITLSCVGTTPNSISRGNRLFRTLRCNATGSF